MGPVRSGSQVGIGKHDVGALAAEFEGQPLQAVACLPHDDLGGLAGAGEGHLVDAGMLHDRPPGGRPEAGHDIDHAIGDAGLLGQPGEP